MTYHEMTSEENRFAEERHALCLERIREIKEDPECGGKLAEYITTLAGLLLQGEEVRELLKDGPAAAGEETFAALREKNRSLYEDIRPEHYAVSFGNPGYCEECFGEKEGKLLCFLYAELRDALPYFYENRLFYVTLYEELFIQAYCLLSGAENPAEELHSALCSFQSDNADILLPGRIQSTLDPEADFAMQIIRSADLSRPDYLLLFGEPVSDNETETAMFLSSLPEEEIDRIARNFTGGFRDGFLAAGRDMGKKKTVQVRYRLGFERVIKRAAELFREMGLSVILARRGLGSLNRSSGRMNGYETTPVNRQYDYDHRYDEALYLTRAFKERRLEVLRHAYETLKEKAGAFAGPAVMEPFGESGFEPENKKSCLKLSEKQENLKKSYTRAAAVIVDQYIPGDETCFTIAAYPVPAIGPDYREIFRETVRVNTLDNRKYRAIQQHIIDCLDKAGFVRITGRGENRTDLKIMLYPLSDPEKQTRFENCVADMNIPLGETFTSPVLRGTEGTLHVESVFIDGYEFRDLTVTFKDGFTETATCGNFPDEEDNRALVRQVILKNHDRLPMGEFAIGTNTSAYAMAERFGIGRLLPILIAEKTGPHFAVGDTCYAREEESPMFNPDGKEMIARENEVSARRKEDPEGSYFNCHTDITLPYSGLGELYAVMPDGSTSCILRDGRFVLSGTEELNIPLDGKEGEE